MEKKTEAKKEPIFLTFTKSKAVKIARTIRPVTFLIILAITVIFVILSFINLWFIIGIAICAVPLMLSATKTLQQAYFDIQVKKYEDSIEESCYVETVDGAPGTGKSSSSSHRAVLLAKVQWAKLCEEYALLEPFLDEIHTWPDKEREDAEEIIEDYEFYSNEETVPCLWSNTPIYVDGVPTNTLTAAHLLQKKKLPYRSVILGDEIQSMLPNWVHKAKCMALIEMFKYPRHLGEFRFILLDQDSDRDVIYIKSSNAKNTYMLGQEWVLEPRFLKWLYRFLLDHTKKMTKKKSNFFWKLKQVYSAMGYRKYYFTYTSTKKMKVQQDVQTFYLPSSLNCEYDERAFKNIYRCKDQPLEHSAWTSLRLSQEELKKVFAPELQYLDEYTKKEKKEKSK